MKPVWEHTALPPGVPVLEELSITVTQIQVQHMLDQSCQVVSQPVIKSINGNNVFIYL